MFSVLKQFLKMGLWSIASERRYQIDARKGYALTGRAAQAGPSS